MKRILMFSLVLALLGAMVISSAAFAQGSCGDGDGSQARQGTTHQNGANYGPGDGTGPISKCLDLNGDGICGRTQ
jgi:hypothetical protein